MNIDKGEYALKRVESNRVISDEELTEVIKEIQIMNELNSEFIAKYYDYAICEENYEYKENETIIYIRMELCDQTLKDVIEEKQRLFKENKLNPIIDYIISCEILKQLLEILYFIQSKEIIHRDIKPSNILVKYRHNYDPLFKLCDFDSAKILKKSDHDETSNEAKNISVKLLEKSKTNTRLLGTPGYSAPELKTGDYNEKVDNYSIGITALELFHNCLEFDENLLKISKSIDILSDKLEENLYPMIYIHPNDRPTVDEVMSRRSEWSFDREIAIDIAIHRLKIERNPEMYEIFKKMLRKNFPK